MCLELVASMGMDMHLLYRLLADVLLALQVLNASDNLGLVLTKENQGILLVLGYLD